MKFYSWEQVPTVDMTPEQVERLVFPNVCGTYTVVGKTGNYEVGVRGTPPFELYCTCPSGEVEWANATKSLCCWHLRAVAWYHLNYDDTDLFESLEVDCCVDLSPY